MKRKKKLLVSHCGGENIHNFQEHVHVITINLVLFRGNALPTRFIVHNKFQVSFRDKLLPTSIFMEICNSKENPEYRTADENLRILQISLAIKLM